MKQWATVKSDQITRTKRHSSRVKVQVRKGQVVKQMSDNEVKVVDAANSRRQ